MTNHRWTADKNVEFIKEYQRNKCLWDPKHPQYKNRDTREAAYKAMMEIMGMDSVRDVICKIRTLRNTYNNENLKRRKCLINGVPSNKLYVSKIPWIIHLDFLKNVEGFTRETKIKVMPSITQESALSESDTQEFVVSCTLPTKNWESKDPVVKAIDPLENVSTQYFSNTTNDEFDLFGQTVAEKLRQLPLDIALETEEMILSTIRKQRIRLVELKTSSQRSTEELEFHKNSVLEIGSRHPNRVGNEIENK